MRNRLTHLAASLAVSASVVLAYQAAIAANGPWIVVADSGDGSATAVNLATGAAQQQAGLGSQLIGAAATSGVVAFTDFLAGSVRTFQANPQGQFLGVGKGVIGTAPDDVNPEGITLLGEGSRALITDGGTVPGGSTVSLILVDLSTNAELSALALPSVYGVAYDPGTRTAHVLDGLSMEVAEIAVGADGTLHDTGARIGLHGSPQLTRFIASYAGGTRLLVSHKTDGAIEVLDVGHQVSLGRIEGVGTTIGAIAVTPDGTKALVGDLAGSDWAVIDLTTTGFPTDTGVRIAVPAGTPNTFVGTRTFAFLGSRMYFTSYNSHAVSALDWQTLSALPDSYPTGAAPAGLDISY